MTVKLCDRTQKPALLFKLIDPLKQKTGNRWTRKWRSFAVFVFVCIFILSLHSAIESAWILKLPHWDKLSRAMIGLFKMPLSICQSGWRVICNVITNNYYLFSPLGAQIKDIGPAQVTQTHYLCHVLVKLRVHIKDNNNSPHVSFIDFYFHSPANFQT